MATLDKIKSLTVKWSISKAQDTYGYNICSVINDDNGERFKCLGGGYDMLGTSLANFIQKEYQAELVAYINNGGIAHYSLVTYKDTQARLIDNNGHYGMYSYSISETESDSKGICHKVSLDGACGINSIERIINDVLGLTLERKYSRDRKGRVKDTIGFYLYPTESK